MARLLSLDVVRGFTVAGMILVNNGYGQSFEPLRHAQWNGLSLSDLVFPFFLFIMGVSLYLSLSGRGFDFTTAKFAKVLKRTILLLLIGIAINWFDKAIEGSPLAFGELRFWAVMQRIAVCYLVASVMVFTIRHTLILPSAIALLVIYTLIIVLGHGYSDSREFNVLYHVDAWLFGDAHLYHKSAVDPEGLVSTLSAITNVLFGFYCGMQIKSGSAADKDSSANDTVCSLSPKINSVFSVGALLTFAGFIVNFALPYNKRIWSPSFALITSGFCALLLALAMIAVDQKGRRGAFVTFFQAFGVNALIIYITSELMAILFGHFGINDLIYNGLALIFRSMAPASVFAAKLTSLAYALCFVLLNFTIAYPLFRRRIYIKL